MYRYKVNQHYLTVLNLYKKNSVSIKKKSVSRKKNKLLNFLMPPPPMKNLLTILTFRHLGVSFCLPLNKQILEIWVSFKTLKGSSLCIVPDQYFQCFCFHLVIKFAGLQYYEKLVIILDVNSWSSYQRSFEFTREISMKNNIGSFESQHCNKNI